MKTITLTLAVLFSTVASAQIEWEKSYGPTHQYGYLHDPLPIADEVFAVAFENSRPDGIRRTELRTYRMDNTLLSMYPLELPERNVHCLHSSRAIDGTLQLVTYQTDAQTPNDRPDRLYFHHLANGVFVENFQYEFPTVPETFELLRRLDLPDGGVILSINEFFANPPQRTNRIVRLAADGTVLWQSAYTNPVVAEEDREGFDNMTFDADGNLYLNGEHLGREFLIVKNLETGASTKDIEMGVVSHPGRRRIIHLDRFPNGTAMYLGRGNVSDNFNLGFLHSNGFTPVRLLEDRSLSRDNIRMDDTGHLRLLTRHRRGAGHPWIDHHVDTTLMDVRTVDFGARYHSGRVIDSLHNAVIVRNGDPSRTERTCQLVFKPIEGSNHEESTLILKDYRFFLDGSLARLVPGYDAGTCWIFSTHPRPANEALHRTVLVQADGTPTDTMEIGSYTFAQYRYVADRNRRFLRWRSEGDRLIVQRLYADLRENWSQTIPKNLPDAAAHLTPGTVRGERIMEVGPDRYTLGLQNGEILYERIPSEVLHQHSEVRNARRFAAEHWFDVRPISNGGRPRWGFHFYDGTGRERGAAELPLQQSSGEPTTPQVFPTSDGFLVTLDEGTNQRPSVRLFAVDPVRQSWTEFPYRLDFRLHPQNQVRQTEAGLWLDHNLIWLAPHDWVDAKPEAIPDNAHLERIAAETYVAAQSVYQNNARRTRLWKFRVPDPVFEAAEMGLSCPEFKIAPNPNRGRFRWTVPPSFSYPVEYSVSDAQGQLRYRGTKRPTLGDRPDDFQLHLEHLPGGLYFLALQDSDGQRTVRSFMVR